jgi:hypothetical protein
MMCDVIRFVTNTCRLSYIVDVVRPDVLVACVAMPAPALRRHVRNSVQSTSLATMTIMMMMMMMCELMFCELMIRRVVAQ